MVTAGAACFRILWIVAPMQIASLISVFAE